MIHFFHFSEEEFKFHHDVCKEFEQDLGDLPLISSVNKCLLVKELLTKLNDGFATFILFPAELQIIKLEENPKFFLSLKQIHLLCREFVVHLRESVNASKRTELAFKFMAYTLLLEAILCFNVAVFANIEETNYAETNSLTTQCLSNLEIIQKDYFLCMHDIPFENLFKKLLSHMKLFSQTLVSEMKEPDLEQVCDLNLSSNYTLSHEEMFDFLVKALGAFCPYNDDEEDEETKRDNAILATIDATPTYLNISYTSKCAEETSKRAYSIYGRLGKRKPSRKKSVD